MALPLALILLTLNAIKCIAVPYSESPSDSPSYRSPSIQARADSPYAPQHVDCPTSPLTRTADGISPAESQYVSTRYAAASSSLQAWLNKTGAGFVQPDQYPTLALATSGGGFRALLTGAGVHQALDSRDGNSTVSGLYQTLTYESGLSGGGWLLGSIAGNNWPTITDLQTNLWDQTFQDGLLLPDNIRTGLDDVDILSDLAAKDAAGFSPTLVDAYGRFLGYALLEQAQGGVADTISGLTRQSGFTSSSVPFPILTGVGVDGTGGQCYPNNTVPIYELTPYEFGSWDTGIDSFTAMQYIGSRNNQCVTGYDNLGYIMGTSSDVLNGVCLAIPDSITAGIQDITNALEDLLNISRSADTRALLAPYPNPFASEPTELDLADGGESDQNVPIWPFLHRDIDVLFITDSSSDTDDNYPGGNAIYETYTQAQANGLSRMPSVPDPTTYLAQGLNKRPSFFGCNDSAVTTIIYLPNTNYTYDSGQDTFKVQYNKAETDAMIANGNAVGSFNGNETWGVCVGCAILKKSGTQLPASCSQCFSDFCVT